MDSEQITEGLSDDAKTALYWINGWRGAWIADYDNTYEFWCAREWAAHIIAKATGAAA